jgi:hypothetical protein
MAAFAEKISSSFLLLAGRERVCFGSWQHAFNRTDSCHVQASMRQMRQLFFEFVAEFAA